MRRHLKNSGFSLVEITVSLGIFMLLLASVSSLVFASFSYFNSSGDQRRAEQLVREGVEAVKVISKSSWNSLAYASSSLYYSPTTTTWMLQEEGTVETIGAFTRYVEFFPVFRDASSSIVSSTTPGAHVDALSKRAVVNVLWTSVNNTPMAASESVYLSAWNANAWNQTSWWKGAGQALWSDAERFESSDQLDFSTQGQLKVAKITENYLGCTWNFATSTEYSYDPAKITVSGGKAALVGSATTTYSTTTNADFASNANGWTKYDWGVDAGEITITGAHSTTGGNPTGYYRFSAPKDKDDKVGAWIEQSFTIPQTGGTSTLNYVKVDLDWSFISKASANPTVLYFYAFVDQSPGVPPATGTPSQVWSSGNVAATTTGSWRRVTNLNIAGVASTSGTYVLKLAIWMETPSVNAGAYVWGFDNTRAYWSQSYTAYPVDKPAITGLASCTAERLGNWVYNLEASETVVGSSRIYYQLSNDSTNWRYWNGSAWSTATNSSQINSVSEVAANFSVFPTATRTLYFKAFLSSNGYVGASLDDYRVYYVKYAPMSASMDFIVATGSITNSVANNNYRSAFRFKPTRPLTVNTVRLYQASSTGSGDNAYTVDIRPEVAGKPGTTILGTGDYVDNRQGVWVTATMTPAVVLSTSSAYYIVVTVSGPGSWDHRYGITYPNSLKYPFDNAADPFLNYYSNTKSTNNTWQSMNATPAFLLTGAAGEAYGQPIHAKSNQPIYGGQQAREKFVYRQGTTSIIGFAVRARKMSAAVPADDLEYSIYNQTLGQVLASGTIAYALNASTSVRWETAYLASKPTTTPGTAWEIIVSSPNSSSTNGYYVDVAVNADEPILNSLNYDATSSIFGLSSNGGADWTDYDNQDMNYKLVIESPKIGGYFDSGELVSSAFKVPLGIYPSLEWDIDSPCSECIATVQLQTAPDAGGVPGAWYPFWCGPFGKDDEESDFFDSPFGQSIDPNINGDQWVRYKVKLYSDSSSTPVLNELRINYR